MRREKKRRKTHLHEILIDSKSERRGSGLAIVERR